MGAVVLDCDGVLVDSEELAWSAWRASLAPFGLKIAQAEIALLTGRTESDAFAHFAARADLPPYESFQATLAESIHRLFEQHLEAFEDAADTLEVLQQRGTALAVASSSPRLRLDLSLATTGLSRFFDVVVAGDEVENGKPHPDLYLAAAERLSVHPSSCTAVEDAPVGVASAKAAGMRVVAVLRGTYDSDELGSADVVVPRLTPSVLLG